MKKIKITESQFSRLILKEDIFNIMTVDTYEEGINLLIDYLGTPEENPYEWKKIEKPLQMWKDATEDIRLQIKDSGMSGDSEVDESDTWWSAILDTLNR